MPAPLQFIETHDTGKTMTWRVECSGAMLGQIGIPSARRRPAATDSGRLAQERAAGSGCAKRVMPPGPAIRILPLRRNRATGVPAACRHPGEVAARRRFWMVRHSPPDTAQMMDAAPSRTAHPHPPAGGRGDGPRAPGTGTGQRHRGAGIEADIATHGSGARGICGSTWRLTSSARSRRGGQRCHALTTARWLGQDRPNPRLQGLSIERLRQERHVGILADDLAHVRT